MGYRPRPMPSDREFAQGGFIPRPPRLRPAEHVYLGTTSIEERARIENAADELWVLQVKDTEALIKRLDAELETPEERYERAKLEHERRMLMDGYEVRAYGSTEPVRTYYA